MRHWNDVRHDGPQGFGRSTEADAETGGGRLSCRGHRPRLQQYSLHYQGLWRTYGPKHQAGREDVALRAQPSGIRRPRHELDTAAADVQQDGAISEDEI